MSDPLSAAAAALSREPLSLQVARALRDLILSGALPAGEPLPSEKELGEQLGVGRSTVREALRVVQAQGLISGGEQVSTRRPLVTPEGAGDSAASALETALAAACVPLAELVALRVLLEQEVMRLAARGKVDLGEAEQAVAEMRAAGDDVERFHLADVNFHAALARCAGNSAFTLVMNVLRDAQAAHLRSALEAEAEPAAVQARILAEHVEILEALRRAEPERAAALVRAHIEGFYARHLP